jgi:hypothetical protein
MGFLLICFPAFVKLHGSQDGSPRKAYAANGDPNRTSAQPPYGRSGLSLVLPTPTSSQPFEKQPAAIIQLLGANQRVFKRWLMFEIYCSAAGCRRVKSPDLH